jgi:hypothetical protein
LLALALVAGGTWWLGTKSDEAGTPPAPTTSPTAPANAVDPTLAIEQRLPALPGRASPDDSTMSIDRAVAKQALTPAEAELVKAIGANEVIYRASVDPVKVENGTLLLAIPTPSVIKARQLAAGLRQDLANSGFTATRLGPGDEDVAYSQRNTAGRVDALWYTSGTVVVGTGVSQPLADDPGPLRPRLEQLIELARRTLPAD